MCFTFQPLSTNSVASQSSNSGCVGKVAWVPQSSSVRTIPWPKNIRQRRLTNTRATSGLFGAAIQRARSSRVARAPLVSSCPRKAGMAGVTIWPESSCQLPRDKIRTTRGSPATVISVEGIWLCRSSVRLFKHSELGPHVRPVAGRCCDSRPPIRVFAAGCGRLDGQDRGDRPGHFGFGRRAFQGVSAAGWLVADRREAADAGIALHGGAFHCRSHRACAAVTRAWACPAPFARLRSRNPTRGVGPPVADWGAALFLPSHGVFFDVGKKGREIIEILGCERVVLMVVALSTARGRASQAAAVFRTASAAYLAVYPWPAPALLGRLEQSIVARGHLLLVGEPGNRSPASCSTVKRSKGLLLLKAASRNRGRANVRSLSLWYPPLSA